MGLGGWLKSLGRLLEEVEPEFLVLGVGVVEGGCQAREYRIILVMVRSRGRGGLVRTGRARWRRDGRVSRGEAEVSGVNG